RLLGVHQVDAVVERSTRRVPYYPGLSVDRTFVLCGDKVEAAHIRRRNRDARAETARSQTVRVYVGEDCRRTLSTSWTLIGDDDLAAVRARSDSDTAETASSRRDRLLRVEGSPRTETRHRRPTRDHASALIPVDPHAAVAHSNRRLVNTATARSHWCTESGAAVGAQNHVNLGDGGVEIDEEEVAERVPGRLSIAACHTGGDRAARPGRAGICRVRAEDAGGGSVRGGHDVIWVGRVH